VANSSFTQDFNRYSYARNNPLMYTDPTGEFIWVPIMVGVIAATYSGTLAGYSAGKAVGATGWDMAAYMFSGGFIGGFSSAIGAGIGTGAAAIIGGAAANTIGGAIGGLCSGILNSGAMAALAGGNVGKAMWQGGLIGMGAGAAFGAMADIDNALDKRALLFSAARELGIDKGSPIPEFNRTKEWVEYQIKGRFPGAKRPDNIFLENGGPNLTDKKTGKVHAGSVVAHRTKGINSVFTGGSDMYLHSELAFSSLKKFYNVLGHELFHVSQYAALAGQIYVNTEPFTNMLEHYANKFSNSYSWGWGYYTPITSQDFSTVPHHHLVRNFDWTKNIYVPGNPVLDFLKLRP